MNAMPSSVTDTVVSSSSSSNHHHTTATKFVSQPLHSHWGVHSPVVSAMLHGNRMNTCADIQAILEDCVASNSHDSICKTAALYFESCSAAASYQEQ